MSMQRLFAAALVLAALAFASACDRRTQGESGDLSPETGATTPTPDETTDPDSGTASTATTASASTVANPPSGY